MDKLVFINQVASHLSKDIINAFAEKIENVSLIAGNISETGNPLHNNIKVSRIAKYNRKNTFSRLFTWTIATVQTIILVKLKFRSYHLLLSSNPPTLAFIPVFCRNKYSVQILDIYPNALVSGGFISENSWLNKLWIKRNRKYFAGAKNVFTLTEGMAKTISQYCDIEKIKVIAQWPSSTNYIKIERIDNKFISTNALEDYFIVMYSGNIGIGHHVEILVEVANVLKEYKDVLFVIVGEGWNKQVIRKRIKEYRLENCLLLPFQSVEMFKHSIQAADIGVVSVSKELATLCVPIKINNLIINEIPLLSITEGESELKALVSKYEIGKCFAPHQLDEISNYIISLKADKEKILSYKEKLRICSKEFSPQNAYSYVNGFNT